MSNIEANSDMSLMIKLTPTEIKNLMRDFADRWQKAVADKTEYTIHQLCDTYYDLAITFLDEDRFVHTN